MPVMHNTGDWFNLRPGSIFRKVELYTMDWHEDIDLEQMIVCGAPYGGPIALVRDFNQILEFKQNTDNKLIYIFTSAGSLISSFKWKHAELIAMGWTESEELVCIQSNGLVYTYDMFGQEKSMINIGRQDKSVKLIDAKIFPTQTGGTGIAVMTKNFRIFFILNIKAPKEFQMPEIPTSAVDPTSWGIVSEKQNTYCLVAMENELLKLVHSQSSCSRHVLLFEKPFKSIILMSVSFNHRYLALYTNNGIVWLGTTDLEKKFCEFDTGRMQPPKQIEWILDPENCRQSDAILISYPPHLLMVNTNGDHIKLIYEPAIFLIPELDGVRVLTYTSHDLVQKVPKCVSNIFAINSQEPASFLFEAHKKFLQKSHQSDEYLNLIQDKIVEAVDECIEAAGYEFDPETQKILIKAAYFGKGLIPNHNPDSYISMCRILRVLNNLRHPKIGLPLTYQEFTNLTTTVVLDRLVFRKQYAMAVHIAKHLKLKESRILEHWAFHKIKYDKDDAAVARKIIEKFKNPTVESVSFCNIAEKAYLNKRNELALKLLDLEPIAANQVPLLLKLRESKKALQSAVKSGDTDLIYTVIFELKSSPDFGLLIASQSIAHNLYKKYCEKFDINAYESYITNYCSDKVQAEFKLREGIENKTLESVLSNIATSYTKAECTIEAELCIETRKLFIAQKKFSQNYKESGVEFYGLTTQGTLEALLKIGELKVAEKFRNEYKIPDKRYWWARIQDLAEKCQWSELEKFCKSKKSPIGYKPFVEVCLQKNNIIEAEKYLSYLKDDKSKWQIIDGKLQKGML